MGNLKKNNDAKAQAWLSGKLRKFRAKPVISKKKKHRVPGYLKQIRIVPSGELKKGRDCF